MPNFSDIVEQYEKIKKSPEITDNLRVKEYKTKGLAADILQKRQKYLPDQKTHAKLQAKLSTMFDKSSRAGAKSTLNGLILPSGRKMFSEFHDNFTGTGRFERKKAPDTVPFNDNGPKIDPNPNRVILYERCADCLERVDMNNFIPGLTFIPPEDEANPIVTSKWRSVDLKPGTVICYLFCTKCPEEAAKALKKIKHDPFKSRFFIGLGPTGEQQTMADKEAQDYLRARSGRISDNVFSQIKYHRHIKGSDIFFGSARLD